MRKIFWPILALATLGTIRAAPSYLASGIVNAIDFSPGPFAPNSVVSIFGTNLSYATQASSVTAGDLPTELGYTRVYVDQSLAPILYVSPGQINFLIPGNQDVGDVKVRVYCQGVYGPEVVIQVKDAVPTLIPAGGGYVAATHADGSLITPDSPAHGGDPVVLYLTGLGKTSPSLGVTTIPKTPVWIVDFADLKVLVAGTAVDSPRVFYAGLTPNFAGLYQINWFLPDVVSADPEIRVAVGPQVSTAGTKLAVK